MEAFPLSKSFLCFATNVFAVMFSHTSHTRHKQAQPQPPAPASASANFLPSVLIAARPPATSSFLLRAAIVFLRVAQFIRGLPRPFNDVK